jgi:hypothetical protein
MRFEKARAAAFNGAVERNTLIAVASDDQINASISTERLAFSLLHSGKKIASEFCRILNRSIPTPVTNENRIEKKPEAA